MKGRAIDLNGFGRAAEGGMLIEDDLMIGVADHVG